MDKCDAKNIFDAGREGLKLHLKSKVWFVALKIISVSVEQDGLGSKGYYRIVAIICVVKNSCKKKVGHSKEC